MGVLSRWLDRIFASELAGAKLGEADPWQIAPTREAARFLRAVPALALDAATLYLEGTSERAVQRFLERHRSPEGLKIALGTVWPRPDCWHLPATPARLEALASLVDRERVAMLSTHAHLYVGERVLLEWHDAFGDEPILVSRRLDRATVARFAEALGTALLAGTDAV